MKYFYDTEFIYGHKKRRFRKEQQLLQLITIGMVCEDGREYYAISEEFDLKYAWQNEWIREHVLKKIWAECCKKESVYVKTYHWELISFTLSGMKNILHWHGKSLKTIARELRNFVMCASFGQSVMVGIGNRTHEFYGYYSDFDHVLLAFLYGEFKDQPVGFPMYTRDLKQMMDERGLNDEWKNLVCPAPAEEHHALADARWNQQLYTRILEAKD